MPSTIEFGASVYGEITTTSAAWTTVLTIDMSAKPDPWTFTGRAVWLGNNSADYVAYTQELRMLWDGFSSLQHIGAASPVVVGETAGLTGCDARIQGIGGSNLQLQVFGIVGTINWCVALVYDCGWSPN